MGNQNSKKINIIKSFNAQDWKQIGTHRQIVKIVQNTKDQTQAELQTIPFDPKRSVQKQTQIYQYRKDQDNALVKCLGLEIIKGKSHALCGNSQILKVLTQRIPLRLNQVPQLSLPESLYALSQSLRGYKDCYNKLGSFDVTDQMIGINNQGEVKVWVNEDFAENHPSFQKPVLQTTGLHGKADEENSFSNINSTNSDESEMIKNIIRVVQKKNQNGKFPYQLSQRLENKPNLTFDQSFKQIQSFSRQRRLFIPDRILNMKIKYGNQGGQTTNISSNSVPIYTPGQQYERDINDPLYRQPRQFSFDQNPQFKTAIIQQQRINSPVMEQLQGGRISSPIIYNQPNTYTTNLINNQSNGQSLNRVSSPIKLLQQQNTPSIIHPQSSNFQPQNNHTFNSSPNFFINQPSHYSNSSKITFNMIRPQYSTLVFDNDKVQYPHNI